MIELLMLTPEIRMLYSYSEITEGKSKYKGFEMRCDEFIVDKLMQEQLTDRIFNLLRFTLQASGFFS